MIVADASVVVDLLLGGRPRGGGSELDRRLRRGEAVAAPHLLDVEVGQALRRHALRGALSHGEVVARLRDLRDLGFHRYPETVLVERAADLMANVTIYDGVYLALAEALDAPLLTSDRRLVDVPGCGAEVIVA